MKIFQGKGPLIFAQGFLENSYEGPRNSSNTEPRENPGHMLSFFLHCDGVESDINRYANYKLGSLW